jgi:hypothetical protein
LHYGRLNGLLSARAVVATAIAPWAGAELARVFGGYAPVFMGLAGLGLLAASPGGRVHVLPGDRCAFHVHPGRVCSWATRFGAN